MFSYHGNQKGMRFIIVAMTCYDHVCHAVSCLKNAKGSMNPKTPQGSVKYTNSFNTSSIPFKTLPHSGFRGTSLVPKRLTRQPLGTFWDLRQGCRHLGARFHADRGAYRGACRAPWICTKRVLYLEEPPQINTSIVIYV